MLHDGRGAVPVHAEAVIGFLQPMGGYFKIQGLESNRPTAHESQGKSEGAVFINVSRHTSNVSYHAHVLVCNHLASSAEQCLHAAQHAASA